MNLFKQGNEEYRSDIVLGEKYRDPRTGLEGHATAVHFYEHACERVTLDYRKADGDIGQAAFDAPQLERADTGEAVRQQRTGGPDRATGARSISDR